MVAAVRPPEGVFPEDHEQFIGGYAGRLSDAYVRAAIEDAECLLATRWFMNRIHPPVDDAEQIMAMAAKVDNPVPF